MFIVFVELREEIGYPPRDEVKGCMVSTPFNTHAEAVEFTKNLVCAVSDDCPLYFHHTIKEV